jgi:hypothetical protein
MIRNIRQHGLEVVKQLLSQGPKIEHRKGFTLEMVQEVERREIKDASRRLM